MADWDQVRQGWADLVVIIIVQFTLCCYDFSLSLSLKLTPNICPFLCQATGSALVLTQPVTEMSTRNISWGVKAAGA